MSPDRLLPLPDPASAHAAGLDAVTGWSHLLIAVLFVGWSVFLLIALWRFRAGRDAATAADAAAPASIGRRWPLRLEVLVVVAEVVLLVGLSIPRFGALVPGAGLAAPAADAVQVRVVAQQYAWNVHYPGADGVFGRTAAALVDEVSNPLGLDRDDPFAADDWTLLNQLDLPVDREAVITLTARDVIHGFVLAEMRVQRDAIPGQRAVVRFTPTVARERPYEIGCGQLCGIGHYRMRGFLTVHDAAGWDTWQAARRAELAAEAELDDVWQ